MTSKPSTIETATLDWRGILIEVRYEARFLGGDSVSHLTLEALEPARAPLPVSETGYRSYFADIDEIEAEGGPLAFAEAWLDAAATSRRWLTDEDNRRQMSFW